MTSITTSESILKVDQLNLIYKMDYYHQTLRDKFVELISSPIETLTSAKDSLHVLKNINIELKKGDRVGLMGVNGAGKTSLARCISGMLVPQTGTVSISGQVRPIFNTNIGVIPELTGRENAYLLGSLLFPEETKQGLKEIVEEALAFSEIEGFLDTPFLHYSKGMQARLCLSIISARPCDLLILDEVFDGADEFFQKKITARVLQLIEDSGAVLFISHAPDQIRQACNRVIVLNKSEIVFDGSVESGIEAYHSLSR